jgi:hypothetical protein
MRSALFSRVVSLHSLPYPLLCRSASSGLRARQQARRHSSASSLSAPSSSGSNQLTPSASLRVWGFCDRCVLMCTCVCVCVCAESLCHRLHNLFVAVLLHRKLLLIRLLNHPCLFSAARPEPALSWIHTHNQCRCFFLHPLRCALAFAFSAVSIITLFCAGAMRNRTHHSHRSKFKLTNHPHRHLNSNSSSSGSSSSCTGLVRTTTASWECVREPEFRLPVM